MGRQRKKGDTGQWKFRLTGVQGDAAFKGSTAKLIVEGKHGSHNRIIDRATMSFESSTAAESSTSFGVVTYSPTTGEMDNTGEFRVEIDVTFGDGTVKKWPDTGFDWTEINPSAT